MWTKTLCFFHEDTRPSACYSEDGGYICFSCGLKGSLLQLIMEEFKLERSSAIKRYQELTGETYQEVSGRHSLFPGREILTGTRDYERGTGLFPVWFCD